MPSDNAAVPAPVFDGAVLREMFGADTQVIAAVLRTFRDSMESSVAEVLAVSGSLDPAALFGLGHRIQGAARMSGAMALADAAQRLEQAAKQGAIAAVPLLARELSRQWQHLQADPAWVQASMPRPEN